VLNQLDKSRLALRALLLDTHALDGEMSQSGDVRHDDGPAVRRSALPHRSSSLAASSLERLYVEWQDEREPHAAEPTQALPLNPLVFKPCPPDRVWRAPFRRWLDHSGLRKRLGSAARALIFLVLGMLAAVARCGEPDGMYNASLLRLGAVEVLLRVHSVFRAGTMHGFFAQQPERTEIRALFGRGLCGKDEHTKWNSRIRDQSNFQFVRAMATVYNTHVLLVFRLSHAVTLDEIVIAIHEKISFRRRKPSSSGIEIICAAASVSAAGHTVAVWLAPTLVSNGPQMRPIVEACRKQLWANVREEDRCILIMDRRFGTGDVLRDLTMLPRDGPFLVALRDDWQADLVKKLSADVKAYKKSLGKDKSGSFSGSITYVAGTDAWQATDDQPDPDATRPAPPVRARGVEQRRSGRKRKAKVYADMANPDDVLDDDDESESSDGRSGTVRAGVHGFATDMQLFAEHNIGTDAHSMDKPSTLLGNALISVPRSGPPVDPLSPLYMLYHRFYQQQDSCNKDVKENFMLGNQRTDFRLTENGHWYDAMLGFGLLAAFQAWRAEFKTHLSHPVAALRDEFALWAANVFVCLAKNAGGRSAAARQVSGRPSQIFPHTHSARARADDVARRQR